MDLYLKSFVKKSSVQTVNFAIIFVTFNGHTNLLFKTGLFSVDLPRGAMGLSAVCDCGIS